MSTGFQYQVYVGETKEKGRGIFTREFIPKGSLVWTLTNINHLSFTHSQLLEYLADKSDIEKKFIINHIYIYQSKAILCTDNAELVNHSSQPNLCESDTDQKMGCWSVRDILPNEELLDSYKTYETPQWYLELCKSAGVESSADVARLYS